jgi:DNA repair exonuclease SbcCD ATPase subunit
VNVHWARGQEQKAAPQPPAPASDTAENRVLVWQDFPQTQDQTQDKQRTELDALRQRVRELEAQLNDRKALELEASEKARAQMAEDMTRQAGRLNNERYSVEIQDLKLMLASEQEKLERLQTTYKDNYPEVKAVRQKIAEIEDSLLASERQLAQESEARNRLAEIQAQRLAEAQSQQDSSAQALTAEKQAQQLAQQRINLSEALQRTAALQRQLLSKPTLSNWTVKGIEVEGLSASARDTLLASLPVKAGGKLTEGSVDAIAAAVKKFDQHLTFNVTLDGSGDAVIHISRPKI